VKGKIKGKRKVSILLENNIHLRAIKQDMMDGVPSDRW